MISYFLTPTSRRISTTNDFQSRIVRSTPALCIQSVHNRHARTRAEVYTCRPRETPGEPRVTVVLIELLFQLMSAFIMRRTACRSGIKKNTRPAQGAAARSQKRRAFIFCRVHHESRHDLRFSFPPLPAFCAKSRTNFDDFSLNFCKTLRFEFLDRCNYLSY